jgi:hypothetical protein
MRQASAWQKRRDRQRSEERIALEATAAHVEASRMRIIALLETQRAAVVEEDALVEEYGLDLPSIDM